MKFIYLSSALPTHARPNAPAQPGIHTAPSLARFAVLLTLEWVAAQLNLSQRQFSRRLQPLTGLSPNHYLQEMRLQLAKYFLLNGKFVTVKETGFAVGFRDAPYFSTLFQERFGVAPSAYLR